MIGLPRSLARFFLLAALAGCATTTRPPDQDPAAVEPSDDRRWRALLLQAEDTRRTNDAVLEGLDSQDPERRRLAVRTLGRLGDKALLPAINDPDGAVRAAAVFAAGISRLTDSLPAIIARRSDTEADVRTAVALALGLFATPETIAPLVELLADTEPDVRIATCYSIARLEGGDALVEPLVQLLGDENKAVAGAATYALSRLSGNRGGLSLQQRFEVRRHLIQLADDRDAYIRMLVAEGLFNPVAGLQADTLANLMRDSDEREVLLAIIRSTSFPGAPTFVIHEVTIRHTDDMIVLATLRGLAHMRGPQPTALLIDFIVTDKRPWLQAEAIRALGRADGSTAVQIANGLSNDDSPVIQAAAAETLYGRPEPAAAEYASRLFGSAHPWVRYHAIPAMGNVTEHLTEVFADLLVTGTTEEKIQIARAAGYRLGLGQRPEADYDDAFELLAGLWRSATKTEALALQVAVLDAAAEGAKPGGAALIRNALNSVDVGIRHHAASVLQAEFGETVEVQPMQPRPLEFYEGIIDWSRRRHAAIVTVFRPGFDPGAFTLSLDAERSPMTAWRFAQLADAGYYNQRRVDEFLPGVRLHSGRGGENRYAATSWRAEPVVSTFPAGTLAAVATSPDALLGEFVITLNSRPNYLGRYWPFGRVVQSLPGVVSQMLPFDRVVSIRMYEGTGRETLPPKR